MQIPHLFPVNLIRLNVWNAKRHAILNETRRAKPCNFPFPSSPSFVPYFTADGTRRVEGWVGGFARTGLRSDILSLNFDSPHTERKPPSFSLIRGKNWKLLSRTDIESDSRREETKDLYARVNTRAQSNLKRDSAAGRTVYIQRASLEKILLEPRSPHCTKRRERFFTLHAHFFFFLILLLLVLGDDKIEII